MPFLSAGVGMLAGSLLSAGIGAYSANKAADKQSAAAERAAQLQLQAQREAAARSERVVGEQAINQNNALDAGIADVRANAAGSIDTLNAGFDRSSAPLRSYLDLGEGANSSLSNLYGFGGNGTPNFSAVSDSPEYQFAAREGSKALDRTAAARGGLVGGGQLRAAQDYGQGLASNQFGNYFTRLMQMSGVGQNAANQYGSLSANNATAVAGVNSGVGNWIGNARLQTAGNIAGQATGVANQLGANQQNAAAQAGQYIAGGGQAEASGIVGAGNALSAGISGGLNNYANYNMMAPFFARMAGGSAYGGNNTNNASISPFGSGITGGSIG